MIALMLDTGLRLLEATNLKWKHINFTSGELFVKEGKGAKDRIVYITNPETEDPQVYGWEKRVEESLLEWKKRQVEELEKREISKKLEYVFTTLKGTKVLNRYVRKMVKRQAEKAGINKDISPHTLRHTFATNLYKRTNNIRRVQKVLGHSDLSTTMIYTHIVDKELEVSMRGNFQKVNS